MGSAEQNLREFQRQLDMDGIEVGVSRQALEEVLAELEQAKQQLAEAERVIIEIDATAGDTLELDHSVYDKSAIDIDEALSEIAGFAKNYLDTNRKAIDAAMEDKDG